MSTEGGAAGAAISLRATLANSKWLGTACPKCNGVFAVADQVVLCPSCFSAHHASCWRENGNTCAKDQTPGRIIEPRGRGASPASEVPAPVQVQAPTPAAPVAAPAAVARPAAPAKPAAPAAPAKGAGPAVRDAKGLRPMEGVRARIESATSGLAPVFGTAIDEVTVTVPPENLPEAARRLKETDGLKFDYLRCLSGVDYQSDGIEVVYHLFSTRLAQKCVLKTRLAAEGDAVGTVTTVWAGADWHERETAEMFNIRFEGHPYPEPLLLERDDQGTIVPGPVLLKRFKLRPKEPPAQYGFPEEE
ncbi:MAG: NADH-quinone oxidoreductase subunit C [Chloroflexota bacterium]